MADAPPSATSCTRPTRGVRDGAGADPGRDAVVTDDWRASGPECRRPVSRIAPYHSTRPPHDATPRGPRERLGPCAGCSHPPLRCVGGVRQACAVCWLRNPRPPAWPSDRAKRRCPQLHHSMCVAGTAMHRCRAPPFMFRAIMSSDDVMSCLFAMASPGVPARSSPTSESCDVESVS